jgi:nucleoside-diphosphate-sugar epimerase
MNESPPASSGWKARRCLVTGGGGFIGHALCAQLLQRGASVYACGRSAPNVAGVTGSLSCNVADLERTREVFADVRPEVVFHCASKVTGSRDPDVVMPTLYDNLVGTVNVLQAATEQRNVRVVCLGSLQEPDDTIRGIAPSPYAAAKFSAGVYLRMFAGLYSLPANIARPFMVYGPGQLDYTKLVPHVLKSLLSDAPARMSSGLQQFDWVYVDDVVDALIATAARDELCGETIDIGSGALTSVRDIAKGIGRRLRREQLLEFGVIPDRRLEPTRAADLDRTSRLIGWQPRVGLDEGLDRTVAWYRAELGDD